MKKHKIKYLFISVVLTVLSGCIDPILLDLPSGEPKLVVFGWITDASEPYEISISVSNDFNDPTAYQTISGTEVYVLNTNGQRFDFDELENTGKYYSDPTEFVGIAGIAYQLHLNSADGKQYISNFEELRQLPALDSAFINFIVDPELFEVADNQENYFVTGFIDDIVGTANYYRWKVYVNGALRNEPRDLTLFDDQFTDGNIFRFDASNITFLKGDQVRIEHLSMTEMAYDYYKLLKNQTENNQLAPRPLPAIINGNIRNATDPNELVLGYFGTSQVYSVALE